jgi:hypothetical protein
MTRELSSHNRLPQDITSSSWEALESFATAEKLSRIETPAVVTPLFRRAVQLDPQFAMALMRLGDILNSQRNAEEGYRYWREAVEQTRTQRLSDHERPPVHRSTAPPHRHPSSQTQAQGHPELAKENGRVEYLTYSRRAAPGNEIRMIRIEFR